MGAVIVALSGVAGAYALNASAKQSLIQVEGFIALVRYIRAQIECFCMPMPQVLERCERDLYTRCGYFGDGAPRSAYELLRGCKIADARAATQLTRFFESIGKGYRDGQIALCDYCIATLEERRRALCEQLPIRKKINGALCVCASLAIVILLI